MINTEFVHYSRIPLVSVQNVEQATDDFFKPTGLWITPVDGPDCWRAWCEAEGYRLEDLACRTPIHFDDDRVLWLRSGNELDSFTNEYRRDDELFRRFGKPYNIDWPLVARRYSGLIIAPYQWSRRLELSWYYSWDCASGCIWDASIVTSPASVVSSQAA